jgi:hypothetical protein
MLPTELYTAPIPEADPCRLGPEGLDIEALERTLLQQSCCRRPPTTAGAGGLNRHQIHRLEVRRGGLMRLVRGAGLAALLLAFGALAPASLPAQRLECDRCHAELELLRQQVSSLTGRAAAGTSAVLGVRPRQAGVP